MTDTSVAAVAPVAPAFNRAEHCRRIAAHGGAVTVARHGTAHMRIIGTAGAQSTIRKHGLSFFQGIVQAKGWHGRRPVSLAVDLAAGRVDALLAAAAALALVTTLVTASPASARTFPVAAPEGCAVTYYSPDDHSATAVCAGGYVISKQDGSSGTWDDIPYAVATWTGIDAAGVTHELPIYD